LNFEANIFLENMRLQGQIKLQGQIAAHSPYYGPDIDNWFSIPVSGHLKPAINGHF
jgi:hypothetical protein